MTEPLDYKKSILAIELKSKTYWHTTTLAIIECNWRRLWPQKKELTQNHVVAGLFEDIRSSTFWHVTECFTTIVKMCVKKQLFALQHKQELSQLAQSKKYWGVPMNFFFFMYLFNFYLSIFSFCKSYTVVVFAKKSNFILASSISNSDSNDYFCVIFFLKEFVLKTLNVRRIISLI